MNAVKILGSDYNRIMRTMRNFVAKNESRKTLNYIRLESTPEIEGSSLIAVGLDGFVLAKIVVPILHDVGAEYTPFEALISITPNTKAEYVVISHGDGKTSIEHVGLYTFVYPSVNGTYINWKQIMPERESTYEISVNPHYLAKALSTYPQDAKSVMLKFGNPLYPILIERNGDDDQVLVMPVRTYH
jgi:DNA polymerase III sliding clamp (beta) subunit (PCNA family)